MYLYHRPSNTHAKLCTTVRLNQSCCITLESFPYSSILQFVIVNEADCRFNVANHPISITHYECNFSTATTQSITSTAFCKVTVTSTLGTVLAVGQHLQLLHRETADLFVSLTQTSRY